MKNITAIVQLKAYARLYSLWLGGLWSLSFGLLCTPPFVHLGSLLYLVTPLAVGLLTVRFRNEALSGFISFRRAFAFAFYLGFYATLLFAVFQYVYLRFIDHGNFFALLSASINDGQQLYRALGIDPQLLRQTMQETLLFNVGSWVFQFMIQNILGSVFTAAIVALFCKRQAPQQLQNNHHSDQV